MHPPPLWRNERNASYWNGSARICLLRVCLLGIGLISTRRGSCFIVSRWPSLPAVFLRQVEHGRDGDRSLAGECLADVSQPARSVLRLVVPGRGARGDIEYLPEFFRLLLV